VSAVSPYLKAVFGAAAAGLGAYIVAVGDGHVSGGDWGSILLAAVIAAGAVWGVPNSKASN
jgi:hypothetical protein